MMKIDMNPELAIYLEQAIHTQPSLKIEFGSPKLEMKDLPSEDINFSSEGLYYSLFLPLDTKLFQSLMPNKEFIVQTGKFYYPPGGFMNWHTNSSHEGYRIYATYCKESNKSFFRYAIDGKIYTEWEQAGWNCRLFEVRKDKLYWHCVWSDTDRYSFGFRFAF